MTIGEKRHRATEDKHFKIDDTDFGHPHIATAKSDQEPAELANIGIGGTIHGGSARDNIVGGFSTRGDLNEDVLTDDPLGEGRQVDENLTGEEDKGEEAQIETT